MNEQKITDQSCNNCIVSDWGDWTNCLAIQNNIGTKTRSYTITKLPENGGTKYDISNNTIQTENCVLNVYPPIRIPTLIEGTSTKITVYYSNDLSDNSNIYQIHTSYTYENWGGRIRNLVDISDNTS